MSKPSAPGYSTWPSLLSPSKAALLKSVELCGFTSVTAEKESSQCKKMVVVLLLLKFISKLSDVIRDAAALASCAYEQIQSSGENKIIVEEESPEMGFLPSHLSPLLYSESLESHICLLLS